MPSISVKDVDQQVFTRAFAQFLKKSGKVNVPVWTDMVKTAVYKELPPFEEDWYYNRLAAVARRIYVKAPIGVGGVRKIFGGRYRRGTRPSHYCKSSGSVARKVLQSLEQLGLVKQVDGGGRVLTPQGQRDLDRIASQIKSSEKKRLKIGQ